VRIRKDNVTDSLESQILGAGEPLIDRKDVLKLHPKECARWPKPGFQINLLRRLPADTELQITLSLPNGREIAVPVRDARVRVNYSADSGQKSEDTAGSYHASRRRPLRLVIKATEPVRLNLMICGLGEGTFTGGPLSIMRFAVLAARAGFRIRWINTDGGGIPWPELTAAAMKYQLLETFGELVEYVPNGYLEPLPSSDRDLFMGTLFYTVLQAHATVLAHPQLKNRNVINFLQDTESIFSRTERPISRHGKPQRSHILPFSPPTFFGLLSKQQKTASTLTATGQHVLSFSLWRNQPSAADLLEFSNVLRTLQSDVSSCMPDLWQIATPTASPSLPSPSLSNAGTLVPSPRRHGSSSALAPHPRIQTRATSVGSRTCASKCFLQFPSRSTLRFWHTVTLVWL